MKTLHDGTQVTARSFYNLLDWNDIDGGEYMWDNFKLLRLSQLNKEQYTQLWEHATGNELKSCFAQAFQA